MATYDRSSYQQLKESQNFRNVSGRRLTYQPTLPRINIPYWESEFAYPLRFEGYNHWAGHVIIGDDMYFIANRENQSNVSSSEMSLQKISLTDRNKIEEVVHLTTSIVSDTYPTALHHHNGWIYIVRGRKSYRDVNVPHGSSPAARSEGTVFWRYNLTTKEIQQVGTAARTSGLGLRSLGDTNMAGTVCLIFDHDTNRLWSLSLATDENVSIAEMTGTPAVPGSTRVHERTFWMTSEGQNLAFLYPVNPTTFQADRTSNLMVMPFASHRENATKMYQWASPFAVIKNGVFRCPYIELTLDASRNITNSELKMALSPWQAQADYDILDVATDPNPHTEEDPPTSVSGLTRTQLKAGGWHSSLYRFYHHPLYRTRSVVVGTNCFNPPYGQANSYTSTAYTPTSGGDSVNNWYYYIYDPDIFVGAKNSVLDTSRRLNVGGTISGYVSCGLSPEQWTELASYDVTSFDTEEFTSVSFASERTNTSNQYNDDGFVVIYNYNYPNLDVETLLASEGVVFDETAIVPVEIGEGEVEVAGVTWYIPERFFLDIPANIPSNNLVVSNVRVEHTEEHLGEGRFFLLYPDTSRYRQRGPYTFTQNSALGATLSVSPQSASWMTTGLDSLVLGYELPSGALSFIGVTVSVFERESAQEGIDVLRQQIGAQLLATLFTGLGVLTIGTALLSGVASVPLTYNAATQALGYTATLQAVGAAQSGSAAIYATFLGSQAAVSPAFLAALGNIASVGAVQSTFAASTSIVVGTSIGVGTGLGAGFVAGVGGAAGGILTEGDEADSVDDSAAVTGATFEGIRDLPIDATSSDDILLRIMFTQQQLVENWDGLDLHPTANDDEIYSLFDWQVVGTNRALVFIGDSVTKAVGERYFILNQRLVNDPNSNDLIVAGNFYVVVEVGEAE